MSFMMRRRLHDVELETRKRRVKEVIVADVGCEGREGCGGGGKDVVADILSAPLQGVPCPHRPGLG